MDFWVDTETLVIRASGPVGAVCYFEGQDKCIKIESDVMPTEATAVKDSETGVITLQEDPSKVQAKLDAAWTALRTRRNQLLRDSDFTQMPDSPLSQDKKDSWAAYRQELRDLPDEVTDPTQVEWPLDPTATPVAPVTGSRLNGILGQV